MKKQNKILIGIGSLILLLSLKKAQSVINIKSKKDFIDLVYPYAKAFESKYKIPALFIIAQTALETRYGKSSLFQKYLNIGGVKAVEGQDSVTMKTREVVNGKSIYVYRKFAKYKTLNDSLTKYKNVLLNKHFGKYAGQTKDPVEYARLLQSGKVKYATALKYPEAIESLVNEIERILKQ